MKTEKLHTNWSNQYNSNKKRFNLIMNFIKENHEIVNKFYIETEVNQIAQANSKKEVLYFLFIDCIEAAPQNNLSDIGNSSKLIIDILEMLPQDFTFKELCKSMTINYDPTGNSFFEHLVSRKFKSFAYKKAALLLRKIHDLQNSEKNKMFSDFISNDINRKIPLDAVISFCINEILKLEDPYLLNSGLGRPFNDWIFESRKIEQDAYLLEDLWFWGFFSTKSKEKERKFEFNWDKWNTNQWFYPPSKEREWLPLFYSFIELTKSM